MSPLTERFLEQPFFGNPVRDWAMALVVLVGAVVAIRVLKAVLRSRLAVSAAGPEPAPSPAIYALEHTRWFFYVIVAAYLGSGFLDLPEAVEDLLRALTITAVLLQVGIWLQAAVRASVARFAKRNDEPASSTRAAAIAFLARLAIWSVILILVLSNLGVEISALIAGLGIGGVAAALAVQNVLGDLIASLSLYFDRPFDIGDFIIVGDFMGVVERIGTRSTQVASLGGEQIIFANGDLARSRIRNYRRMRERRIVFTIGIEYNLPCEKVEQAALILREAIEGEEGVRFDRAHFKGFGDFSLLYEVVYYVLSPDFSVYMDRQQAINLAIYRRFEEAEIPFAFPTRTLHLHQEQPWGLTTAEGALKLGPAGRGE